MSINNAVFYGGSAAVEVQGDIVTKTYLEGASVPLRRMEVENLQWAEEVGLPAPRLVEIVYDQDGTISAIKTTFIAGLSYSQLPAEVADEAYAIAEAMVEKSGIPITDLETEGNVRVTLTFDGQIDEVFIMDLGECF